MNSVIELVTCAEFLGASLTDDRGQLKIGTPLKLSGSLLHCLRAREREIIALLRVKHSLSDGQTLLEHQLRATSGLQSRDFDWAIAALLEEGELSITGAGTYSLREVVN